MTTSELSKLKFDPNLYKVNAYQGLAYDPMRKPAVVCARACVCLHMYILHVNMLRVVACGVFPGPVPRGLDLNVVLEQEKVRDRHRQTQTRQRRLSDSSVSFTHHHVASSLQLPTSHNAVTRFPQCIPQIGASTYYHAEQYNPSESFQQPLQYSSQRKGS